MILYLFLKSIGSAISVFRVSVFKSSNIKKLQKAKITKRKKAYLKKFYHPRFIKEKILDICLICWMPKPNSFTGEDCFEIFCHGGKFYFCFY